MVEGVLASLPTEFASYLQNVEVAVEAAPCRDLLQEEDIEHDLLGFYQGDTIQNSEWGLPDRIVLYQRNLENISSDRASLIRRSSGHRLARGGPPPRDGGGSARGNRKGVR